MVHSARRQSPRNLFRGFPPIARRLPLAIPSPQPMIPTPFFLLAKAPRGDPNPIGWLTTFAYFCVAGFCYWAGRREKENAIGRARVRHAPLFWFTLAGVMLALGFNKQLDIQ